MGMCVYRNTHACANMSVHTIHSLLSSSPQVPLHPLLVCVHPWVSAEMRQRLPLLARPVAGVRGCFLSRLCTLASQSLAYFPEQPYQADLRLKSREVRGGAGCVVLVIKWLPGLHHHHTSLCW